MKFIWLVALKILGSLNSCKSPHFISIYAHPTRNVIDFFPSHKRNARVAYFWHTIKPPRCWWKESRHILVWSILYRNSKIFFSQLAFSLYSPAALRDVSKGKLAKKSLNFFNICALTFVNFPQMFRHYDASFYEQVSGIFFLALNLSNDENEKFFFKLLPKKDNDVRWSGSPSDN